MRVAVFLERWQHECCGDEFEVGDEVAWQLAVDLGRRQAQLGRGTSARPVEMSVVRVLDPDGPEPGGLLLVRGGVHAFLPEQATALPEEATALPEEATAPGLARPAPGRSAGSAC